MPVTIDPTTVAPIVSAAILRLLFVLYVSRPIKPGAAHDEIMIAGFFDIFDLRNTGAAFPQGQ